jgi:chromosome segregation ATPase
MKKICLILIMGLFISIPVVYAIDDESTSNENEQLTTTTVKEKVTKAKEKAAQIKEKIIQTKEQIKIKQQIIKANHQTINTLREQLKLKITETKNLIKQYREKETLTKEQIDNIKAKIVAIKDSRQAILTAYGKVGEQIKQYKAKTIDERMNGLDAIITAQQERISMYQNALDNLNK